MRRWIRVFVPIGLNALIPYLGIFLFRARQFGWLLPTSTALLVLLGVIENDVIAGWVYVREADSLLFLLLLALFLHSSYLCLSTRANPAVSWRHVVLPLACIFIVAGSAGFHDSRSLKVASSSLAPLLTQNAIVSLERTPFLDRGELGVALDSKGGWHAGIVLARPGDTIGLAEDVPVSCSGGADENSCYRIDDGCLDATYHRRPTEERSVLSGDQILLATNIRGPDERILRRRIVFSDIYRVAKVYAPERWIDFGSHPDLHDCVKFQRSS